jgi:excisionase family DNA binding protein
MITREYPTLIEIDGLCNMLGIGKNTAYELLNNQEIDAFKIGTVWKIPRKNVEDFIDRKCNERKKIMCKIIG